MEENNESCVLCLQVITGILSDIVIDEQVYTIREMLQSFSTKLINDKISEDEMFLCEECTLELTAAFQFLLKVGKAEEYVENQEKQEKIESFEVPEDIVEPPVKEVEVSYDSDYKMETLENVEKVPPMIIMEPPSNPGPSKKKSPQKTLPVNHPQQLIEPDVDYYPSRVVIFPKFIACQTDAKMLNENIATGRIRRDFLESSHNLKTLDITGVIITQDQNVGELKEEIIQDEQDKDDMFLCRYCPKAFFSAHHLMMHLKKSHMCQFCLQGFNKVNDLHQHIEHEHYKFECHFCPREFSSNNNLRTHLKRRHGIHLPAHVSLIAVDKNATGDGIDLKTVTAMDTEQIQIQQT
ncbi:hypothetical protein DMENIID0001_055930 [Sergentomyia squamirostris]